MGGFMLEHVLSQVLAFFADPLKAGIFAVFLLAALFLFVAVRKKQDIRRKQLLMHLNLLAIAFAVSFLATSLSCSVFAADCAVTISQTVLLAFPLFLFIAVAFSFFLLPRLLRTHCSPLDHRHPLWRFLKNEACRLHMKTPSLLVDPSHALSAYSFNSPSHAIVLSVGTLELLNKKEREAVVLHELNHLSRNNSGFKLSASLYRLFIPGSFASFSACLSAEEKRADAFAARRQGTNEFVDSAKTKFTESERWIKC